MNKNVILAVFFAGATVSAQHFPPLDQDNPPKSRTISPVGAYSFCMTAHRDIPGNSTQPLFTFNFAAPGASRVALIDGRQLRHSRTSSISSFAPMYQQEITCSSCV